MDTTCEVNDKCKHVDLNSAEDYVEIVEYLSKFKKARNLLRMSCERIGVSVVTNGS